MRAVIVQEILVSVRIVGIPDEAEYDIRRWERSLSTHIESWRIPRLQHSVRVESEVVGGGIHVRESVADSQLLND